MTLENAKAELEKFVSLKTTMRPAFVQPLLDAVEQKHGHWIIRDIPGTYFYQITCSECSEDVTSSAPCIGFLPNAKVLWDYCPYCGAKMDEVEENG